MEWRTRRGDDPAQRFDRHVLYLLWRRLLLARRRPAAPAALRRSRHKPRFPPAP